MKVKLPKDILEFFDINEKALIFTDLLSNTSFETENIDNGLSINMPSTSAVILEF